MSVTKQLTIQDGINTEEVMAGIASILSSDSYPSNVRVSMLNASLTIQALYEKTNNIEQFVYRTDHFLTLCDKYKKGTISDTTFTNKLLDIVTKPDMFNQAGTVLPFLQSYAVQGITITSTFGYVLSQICTAVNDIVVVTASNITEVSKMAAGLHQDKLAQIVDRLSQSPMFNLYIRKELFKESVSELSVTKLWASVVEAVPYEKTLEYWNTVQDSVKSMTVKEQMKEGIESSLKAKAVNALSWVAQTVDDSYQMLAGQPSQKAVNNIVAQINNADLTYENIKALLMYLLCFVVIVYALSVMKRLFYSKPKYSATKSRLLSNVRSLQTPLQTPSLRFPRTRKSTRKSVRKVTRKLSMRHRKASRKVSRKVSRKTSRKASQKTKTARKSRKVSRKH